MSLLLETLQSEKVIKFGEGLQEMAAQESRRALALDGQTHLGAPALLLTLGVLKAFNSSPVFSVLIQKGK